MAEARCASCGRDLAAEERFCAHCGAAADTTSPRPGASWAGGVTDGVWDRPPEEFLRRVEPDDMRGTLGRRALVVPAGSVGVVLVDGIVKELLPPGHRTAIGLFERFAGFFGDRTDRTAFFLIDLRPLPIPFTVRSRPEVGGPALETQVVISTYLDRGDREGIARFLGTVVAGRVSLAAADLHAMLRPDVVRECRVLLERAAAQGAPVWDELETGIRARLDEAFGARYGLRFTVSVAPLVATQSLSFHLGTGPAPRVRACVSCGAELPASLGFCDACGTRQPTQQQPDSRCGACGATVPAGDTFCGGCGRTYEAPPPTATALFTADGRQVELDLVVRVQGQSEEFRSDGLAVALVAAAGQALRAATWAAVATPEGFAQLEQALRTASDEALRAFALRVVSLTVLDARSKSEDWLLGGRADMERARQDVVLGREWLEQRSDELDLQEVVLDVALRQQRVQRDHELRGLGERLEGERRAAAEAANHAFLGDESALADRRRRQGLAEGAAGLDVADADRGARRDVGLDLARRQTGRAAAAEDHFDRMTTIGRDGAEDDARREVTQAAERDALAHSMDKERAVFSHEAGLTREAMGLESEKRRGDRTLRSEDLRQQADDVAYATTAHADVAFSDHERRTRLDQSVADGDQFRQIDKLRAMAELEREMTAQEQRHRMEVHQGLRGLTAEEMIAAQAADLARAEGGGAAWAAAIEGRRVAEEKDRRLADRDAHMGDLREVLEAQVDRMADVARQGLATGETERRQTGRVYEGSMDAMSRVASSRAAPTPSVVVPVLAAACVTPGCGVALRPGARFCGACGQPQPPDAAPDSAE